MFLRKQSVALGLLLCLATTTFGQEIIKVPDTATTELPTDLARFFPYMK